MTLHLFVHYLDNIRSSTASSCEGNGPESLVEIIVGVVVWQKLIGPRVKAWHARELAKHHDAIKATLDEHMKSIHAHIEASKETP